MKFFDIIPPPKERKIFFDIIPPERIKVEKPLETRSFSEIKKPLKTKEPLKAKKIKTVKPKKFTEKESFLLKNSLKKRALKIACLFLIIFFGWAGLSNINKTLAYFSDLEASVGNILKSGFLSFELVSFSDFSPYFIDLGEPASRTISIVNYGNNHKYIITADNFSSELCDYLTLEARLNNELKYEGPLVDFIDFGPTVFEDPADWQFVLTLMSGAPQKACEFDFVFFGSQTRHYLPLGAGFTDIKQISNSVAVSVPECEITALRSMGYWKNHPEIYESYLSQFLGGYPEDEKIDTVEKADEIFNNRPSPPAINIQKIMLKKHLLAMKFNVAHFEIGEYLIESENKTINQIIVEADKLLRNPEATKDELEEAKDLIDYLNNSKIEHCYDYLPGNYGNFDMSFDENEAMENKQDENNNSTTTKDVLPDTTIKEINIIDSEKEKINNNIKNNDNEGDGSIDFSIDPKQAED